MSTKHERAIAAAEMAGQDAWKRRGASSADAWAEGIAAYLAVMREPGPDEVRVRACVAVTQHDDWVVWGQNDISDKIARNEATFDYDDQRVTWVEANVPAYAPPTEPVVEGEVVE